MKINISTALKHWPRQKVFGAPIHLLSGVAGSVPRTAVQFWAWTSPDINVSNSICLEAGKSQLKQNVERADYKGLMYDLMTLWPTSTRHRTYWRWHKNQLDSPCQVIYSHCQEAAFYCVKYLREALWFATRFWMRPRGTRWGTFEVSSAQLNCHSKVLRVRAKPHCRYCIFSPEKCVHSLPTPSPAGRDL